MEIKLLESAIASFKNVFGKEPPSRIILQSNLDHRVTLPAPDDCQLSILEPETCDGCGLCCEGIGSPVALYVSRPGWSEIHPFRPAELPDELIREIDDHFGGLFRGQEPQEQCLWFDAIARRCRHYEWRPQVCRDYKLGGDACLARRREFRESPAPRQ